MDEFMADAFANRDEPIPLIAGMRNSGADSDSESKENKQKKSTKFSLQDRLFAKWVIPILIVLSRMWFAKFHIRILQQVIPGEDLADVFKTPTPDREASKDANRPGFSLPLMTNNFRRFNARLVSFHGIDASNY